MTTILESPFDSLHYDLKIGRLVAERGVTLEGVLATASEERFDLVVVRLAEPDLLRGELAGAGHEPVDVLVTSTLDRERARAETRTPAGVTLHHHDRLDQPEDVERVAALTAESITTSHLHHDRRLPLARTRQLYAAWARNDVSGRAQRTIVARSEGTLVGHMTVLLTDTSAVIDLVAVAPAWQGKGIGSAMLASFIEWIGPHDRVATIGTQANNPALSLYGRLGFVPTETHFTYHLWLDEGP